MFRLSLLSLITLGACTSTARLIEQGRFPEATRRLQADWPMQGQFPHYQDDTWRVWRALRPNVDASIDARVLSADQLKEMIGLVPASYGRSWVLIGLHTNVKKLPKASFELNVGLVTPQGTWTDACPPGACSANNLLIELDSLFDAKRTWKKNRPSELGAILGKLSTGFIDIHFIYGTFGQLDPNLRTTVPKIFDRLTQSQKTKVSTRHGALADTPQGRLEASARVLGVAGGRPCALAVGSDCVSFRVLKLNPHRPAWSNAPERALSVALTAQWFDDDGVAAATARHDVPLDGEGDLSGQVRRAWGLTSRTVVDLEQFSVRSTGVP